MENSGKIAELLAESLQRLDQMVGEQKETSRRPDHLESQSEKHQNRFVGFDKRFERFDKRFEGFEKRFESMQDNVLRIERNLVSLNVQTVESTRAVFKLAEKVDGIAELHNRLVKFEKAVFK